ncbi:MAG: GNAT family N-acetyltransferase [Candidatus Omnitrophica bacterium]|nr:GNAT family N-acetyltransferase [Candidatus Omnitrophota bacterium]
MIRSARPEESDAILRFVSGVLASEFPREAPHYETNDLVGFRASYSPPKSTFLVAEEDKKIVGTLGVKADAGKTAILRRLFVDPAYRRRGIGLRLIQSALSFCREQGYQEVVIRTSTRMEKAIHLCQSLRFKEEGRWDMGEVSLVLLRLRLA